MTTLAPPAALRSTQTRLVTLGAWAGAAGPILFTGVYLIAGATRPGYDPWRMAVSALSLSADGWVQIANFLLFGLLTLGFAAGLRRAWPQGRGAIWGPRLLAAVGLGLIAAGLFVMDPGQGYPPGTPDGPAAHVTLAGTLHWLIGATSVFGGLPLACGVVARRFAGDRATWGWAAYSAATALLMIGSFAAFVVASKAGGPAGLYERLAISAGLSWMALLAWRLRTAPAEDIRP